MTHSSFSLIVGIGLMLLAPLAPAQSTATNAKSPLENSGQGGKSSSRAEAESIRKERQTQARSLLVSLASDARSFRDQSLRALSLARIADCLWFVDKEQGRALFRQAWEAAEIADRESKENLDRRGEVLMLASRRDRRLAEEFLQKQKAEERQQESKSEALWELREASQQRLNLARGLLGTGDIERALQFADPVLGTVTISTVDFLTQLREKDPAAADRRYAAMLASTNGDLSADANTISLLSSYIFTPYMYVVFNKVGGADSSWLPSSVGPVDVSPQLRLAFFQTASSVLVRPQPPPEQDQSTTGIAGKYMAVKRLMPLFEQYAPQEITAALRGQFEALNSLVSDRLRESENEWIDKGIKIQEQIAHQESSLLDDIERAKTSDERDQLYFKLALLVLDDNDMRARNYVSKIEESVFRKQGQAWVDACLAISAIKKKKIAAALELARIGDLTHIQRVWLLSQMAKLLAKTDRERALSLLADATAEARRIDGSDLDRPRGLLAIANALRVIEPSRVWDAVFDVVKAANSTEGFTGEGGELTMTVTSPSKIVRKTESVSEFDVAGIFGELGKSDYDRAVQLARGFQGEALRANATIAISRSMLDEKGKPASTKN
jgi:hypothetical protein